METKATPDHLLEGYFRADNKSDADAAFGRLVSELAGPLVKSIVTRKLGSMSSVTRDDIEDVVQTSIGLLFGALSRERQRIGSGEPGKIENLKAYMSTIALRECDGFLRRHFPNWNLLSRQVETVIKATSFLIGSKSDSGTFLVSREEWYAAGRSCDEVRVSQVRSNLEPSARAAFADLRTGDELWEFVSAAVHWFGGPIPFNLLVTLVSVGTGSGDPIRVDPPGEGPGTEDPEPHRGPSPGEVVELRDTIAQLVREIAKLPPRHAQALLLNFGDSLNIFLITHTSDLRSLAAILQMEADHLASIWNELPWPDIRIAEFMQCETKDVFLYRMQARRKLKLKLPHIFRFFCKDDVESPSPSLGAKALEPEPTR